MIKLRISWESDEKRVDSTETESQDPEDNFREGDFEQPFEVRKPNITFNRELMLKSNLSPTIDPGNPGYLCIDVIDTGVGIGETDKSNIF